jgi:Glycosyltransferase family 87
MLLVPFLVCGRRRAAAYGLVMYVSLTALPLLFDGSAWGRYFGAGVQAARANAARSGNASLLNLGQKLGIASVVTLLVLFVAAALVSMATRDLF